MSVENSRPKLLMCAPDFYGVNYIINPWMEGNVGRAARDRLLAVQRLGLAEDRTLLHHHVFQRVADFADLLLAAAMRDPIHALTGGVRSSARRLRVRDASRVLQGAGSGQQAGGGRFQQ